MDNSQKSEIEGIDIEKVLTVLRKSWLWLLLIFAFTNISAYLVIRWTKPLYESSSELKLDVETNATELGLTTIGENQNLNIISGEIELLKSKLFFNKVIDNFDLDVSYYTAGNVLDDEKYKSSPFIVDYEIKDNSVLDKKIGIEIIDNDNFKLNFTGLENDGKKFHFGEKIETDDIIMIVSKTPHFANNNERNHFFTINSRTALISYLENNLSVVPLNLNANTIKISLKDHNATKARDLVNAIDSLYLNYTQEEKNRENTQKINWLNKELSSIEKQLEGFENYFENFTIENRTNDLNEDLANTIKYINAIDSQRYELSKKINNAQGLLTTIEKDNLEMILNSGSFPTDIKSSIEKLAESFNDYEKLKLSYTESTFALTRKENEINNLKSTLKNQLTALIEKYKSSNTELENRKAKLQRNFVELPGKSTEFNKNQRFFDLYEEFYLSLMQSKAEYQIAQAGTTTQFKILSAATINSKPISPDSLIIHGIGLVAGFVFCFIFVGVGYLLNNKIATPQELERLTDAPILGYIPEEKEKMEQSVLMVDLKPKSAVSESLRSIRTNIDFMVSKKQQRVISVTSTIGGEGKTFSAVNLGAIIAMSKKKVIVLDLDMRKPRVHMSFGDENPTKGISTILIGNHTIEESVVESRVENLHYINAGPTPPNPSELLLNGEFEDLLNRLKLIYDVIILDTPPVGLVTDGILAMKKADLAIYVVRANYSKRDFIKTLNRLVSVNQFKNLAVLLNALPQLRSNNYGYGYGYYENTDGPTKSFFKKFLKR